MGMYHISISKPIVDNLATVGIGIDGETGFEAYYNIYVNDQINIVADVQVIDPIVTVRDPVTIFGLRTSVKF